MPKIVIKRISYGKDRIKDLKELIKFEDLLKGKYYQIFPYMKTEDGKIYTYLEFHIND